MTKKILIPTIGNIQEALDEEFVNAMQNLIDREIIQLGIVPIIN
jgi:hypothetical protein